MDYSFGPMFLESDSKTRKGMTHQIDLVFQRADNVVTVCEARYRDHPETRSIISEIEAKVAALNLGARKTVQRVLITKSIPSNEVIRSGYFYKIIEAGSLIREAQVETTTQPYRP